MASEGIHDVSIASDAKIILSKLRHNYSDNEISSLLSAPGTGCSIYNSTDSEFQFSSYARGEDEDIDSLALWFEYALVEKTGQTETYALGDDGDLQRGEHGLILDSVTMGMAR